MAEPRASGPETLEDPQRLWIWERHVYLDEHKRSWLPIILKVYIRAKDCLKEIYLFVDLGRFAVDNPHPGVSEEVVAIARESHASDGEMLSVIGFTMLEMDLSKTDEKLQVILRQQDVSLGSPMTPEQLEAYELPLLWQLYPGKRYRGSDSMFWQILYHVKFRGFEDLLLEQLESEEFP